METRSEMPLPIDELLPLLRQTLASHAAVVLQAPPGAGKTTRVPPALLGEPWLKDRSILILEPRRLAARAASARMAGDLGEPVGGTVGYRIRFESKISKKTRVEVLTEGILTRRLLSDPALEGVGLVIFDEFHERHLDADLALALCLDARRLLRDDLKLIVMSATLEEKGLSALLGGAPVLTSRGRSYPVEVRYAPSDADPHDLPRAARQAVLQALPRHPGDLLVFLPGGWEIRRTEELLRADLARASAEPIDLHPLYGDLPAEAQERAIRPAGEGHRRVVLATPIAETSLTIEGIGVVIDSGFARVPKFDPATGLTRLATMRISRASAEQRAGRAGRLGPGVCYRLWSEATQQGLMAQPVPEIRGADLAPLALELAGWGARDPASLSWLDLPPAAAMSQARRLLIQLGAVDENGALTPLGRTLAALPLHPRLGHMIVRAAQKKLASLGCDIAALLSERDLLTGPRRSCDFLDRLKALHLFRTEGWEKARSLGADPAVCLKVDRASDQYRRLMESRKEALSGEGDPVGLLLAFAYPDRIALQRGPGDARYLLASGRSARLPEQEQRLRRPALVVASLDAGETEGTVHLAAVVEIDLIRRELAAQMKEEEVIYWDAPSLRVASLRRERLGELTISSAPLSSPDPERVRAALLAGIRQIGLSALPWTPELRDWQARALSLRHWFPDEDWPDLTDAALEERLESWIAPFLTGITRREQLKQVDLASALKAHLDRRRSRRLDEGAPTHLVVPSGSRLRLEYRPGESPALAVKLQEMFGLAETPRVAWGKVPVTLHLLSPARRPIQVTQDLRGFWERTYAEVKKELKGRYPKHPWPDDPWNATPTARLRRPPS